MNVSCQDIMPMPTPKPPESGDDGMDDDDDDDDVDGGDGGKDNVTDDYVNQGTSASSGSDLFFPCV
jgi:hypothetical protein